MYTVAVSGVNLSLAVELLEGNYDMLEILDSIGRQPRRTLKDSTSSAISYKSVSFFVCL